MIRKRYTDSSKLIVDVNELKLTKQDTVLIYCEDESHDEIAVNLGAQAEKFEELKPYIIFIAKNLCKMDSIAQRYTALHGNSSFADDYEIAYICLDAPDKIRLGYYGINENTEFDVVFQHINGDFILKSFGMVKDIPPDWDRE